MVNTDENYTKDRKNDKMQSNQIKEDDSSEKMSTNHGLKRQQLHIDFDDQKTVKTLYQIMHRAKKTERKGKMSTKLNL